MISGDRSLAEGKRGAFYNTLEEFHKYWERIDIICPKTKRGQDPVLFDNVFIHPSPWPIWLQPWWILKKGSEIYREQKFNLLTVHEYPPFYNGLGARMLWNRIKVPYILEIFHIPGFPKAADLKERIYKILFYLFIAYDCRRAKAVRVMNNQVAEKLSDLGVSKSKIKMIPAIYVDLNVFKPMDLEKRYDLIFVGRLAKNKGINLVLETVSKLKVQNPTFKLLVVGDGPLMKFLKSKIENLKLQGNVILYGWAKDSEEVARLLNQSKILIMPSYNEGGPRVVVEAMACGLPILATPVGIVADIMKNGRCCEIISWGSKDIIEKADNILSNELIYQKYSQTALKISAKFEKKSAIRNYAEKIKDLSTV